MAQIYRDPAKITDFLCGWIKNKLAEAGALGCVLGLSGGVDSAVLAALLRRICGRDALLALIMPIHSDPIDEEHARLVSVELDIPIEKVDLTSVYDELLSSVSCTAYPLTDIAKANIKPRIRMTTLYSVAQTRNFLVCGSSNRDELLFGYFTKHGDSGVDMLPFGNLLKGEIARLALYLGVPPPIINKPPTAGLWKGQTDEGDMGVTYDDLDRYIATGEGTDDVSVKVEQAIWRSVHKRNMPPIAEIPLFAD